MPFFGQELFDQGARQGPARPSDAYLDALANCRTASRATQGIDAVLNGKHRLDALVAPTGGPAWLIDLVNGDHYGGGSSSPAAVAGYPNITVPAGLRPRPAGRHLVHRPGVERAALLTLAHAFEQATRRAARRVSRAARRPE